MATILVIDDYAPQRQALTKLLRRHGYRVVTAHDAYSAMGSAKQIDPDLMLLDVGIPPIDGLTFLMLLQQELPEHPPVIVISGLSDVSTMQRAREFGVKEYLVKGDYTPVELLDLISKYIRPSHDQPATPNAHC